MKLNLQRHKQLIDRVDRQKRGGADLIVTILDFFHTPFADGTPQQNLALHLADVEFNGHDIEIFLLAEQVMAVITDSIKRPVLKDVIQTLQQLAPYPRWAPYMEPGGKKPFLLHFPVETGGETLAAKIQEIGERESVKLYAEEKEIAKRKQAEMQLARKEESAAAPAAGGKSAAAVGFHFSPALQLEFIETQLEKINILELARLQPIAKLKGTWLEKVVGQEIYTSLASLVTRFGAQIELNQHYMLLRHLTRHLDRHMLARLTDGGLMESDSLTHVNLSLDSIRTKAFVEFDARLDAQQRSRFVFEIGATEALSDADKFFEAIELLSQRGYGMALDGVSAEALMALDLEGLPLAAVKLVWRSELAQDEDMPRRISQLAAKLPLVLCRSDGTNALVWGASVGIDLYQGTVVDGLCAQSIFSGCESKTKLGCTQDRCRARHWRATSDPGFACTQTSWNH
jgi:hypothetical protein